MPRKKKDLNPATINAVETMQSGADVEKVYPSDTEVKVSGMEQLKKYATTAPVFDGQEQYLLDNLNNCVKNDIAVETRWAFCRRFADGKIDYSRLNALTNAPYNYVRITKQDLKEGIDIELEKSAPDGVSVAMMCLKEHYELHQEAKRKRHNDLLESKFEESQTNLGSAVHEASLDIKKQSVTYS
jgi:hypothetical protein